MKFGVWTAVALLACLVHEGQANIVGTTMKGIMDIDIASQFVSIAASSSLKMNVNAINDSLNIFANSVKGFKTPGQTEQIKSAIDIMKSLAQKLSDVILRVTGAFSNLILDRKTPLADLFDQFKTIPQDIFQFLNGELGNDLNDIKQTIGCDQKEQLSNIIRGGTFQALNIVATVNQISSIVFNSDDLRSAREKKVDPGQLKKLVSALAQKKKNFNDTVIAFTTVFKSAVDAIEKSNKILMSLNSKANKTISKMNSTATEANSTAATQSINVQDKYKATQLSIKTNLTNAITGLSVFLGSKKLKHLADKNTKSGEKLFEFLAERNTSDLMDIAEYFGILGNSTAERINQTAIIFLGAVNLTGLRLTDILLEGGPAADSCFTTFSPIFFSPSTPLTTFVSSCLKTEIKRWTSIVNTADDMLNLIQMNSQDVSSNLGRCSSQYVNYSTSSEDYVRAKACLETNLEDFNALPKVLKPLLQNLNQMVKREVEASIFRMENCLVNNLQEEVARLKNARSEIEICAGMPTNCDRISREDDENEKHKHDRDDKNDRGDENPSQTW